MHQLRFARDKRTEQGSLPPMRLAVVLLLLLLGAARTAQGNTLSELRAKTEQSEVPQDQGEQYSLGLSTPHNAPKATQWLRKAAEQGDATAQSLLGAAYAEGRGVPQDYAQAVIWLRKASDQGEAGAQFALGLLYGQGRGVPQNLAEAAKWWRKAADQGQAYAQQSLAFLYYNGHGVPKDAAKAGQWFRKAAEQGLVMSQFNLGTLYDNGEGMPRDEVKPAGATPRLEAVRPSITLLNSRLLFSLPVCCLAFNRPQYQNEDSYILGGRTLVRFLDAFLLVIDPIWPNCEKSKEISKEPLYRVRGIAQAEDHIPVLGQPRLAINLLDFMNMMLHS